MGSTGAAHGLGRLLHGVDSRGAGCQAERSQAIANKVRDGGGWSFRQKIAGRLTSHKFRSSLHALVLQLGRTTATPFQYAQFMKAESNERVITFD